MTKKQIFQPVSGKLSRLKKYSSKAASNFNEKAIHQFRVEYKRLRAFMRLLCFSTGNKKIKLSGTIKKTYSLAGDLRDLQLQRQRIKKISKQENNKFQPAATLLKNIKLLEIKLREYLSKNPVAGCKKKIIPRLPVTFPAGNLTLFIQHKLAENKTYLSKNSISDVQIHTIRKNLKDLFYNLQLLKKNQYQQLSQLILNGKNEKQIRLLLTDLGDLQDKCVAIKLLKEYPTGTATDYRQIKTQWINEKNHQKRILIKKLKAFFSS